MTSAIWLRGWPWFRALSQTATQVTVREPGNRFLSEPRPIAPYAAAHSEYAWLAACAYLETPAGQTRKARTIDPEEHVDPRGRLRAEGWSEWTDFPSAELQQKFKATHLRAQVWEKETPPILAVTFGGTIFNNGMDWRSNLRWLIPGHRDQYTDVVRTFAPAFIAEVAKRKSDRRYPSLGDATLVSVGHSLGGGLAQQFCYALPLSEQVQRVAHAYAFDPSPVTGFFSVDPHTRDQNKKVLRIERIYERGEILAIVRSLTSVLWKPSAIAPAICGVRYNLFSTVNPIAGHSITRMACRLEANRPRLADGISPMLSDLMNRDTFGDSPQ
jgi:hypothetical protein